MKEMICMANRKYTLKCELQRLRYILLTTSDKNLLDYCERNIREIKQELDLMSNRKKKNK